MKPKLQAQRKFAQGAFVPSAPPIERRAAAEPPPDNGPTSVEVNFISNTRASKILDSIAFSHPGMHIHQPRVVLERLDSSLQTAVKKSHKDSSKKQSNERRNPAKSSRVLRSMRLSSDDDKPLTYHIQLKPKRKPSTVPKRPQRKVAKDKLFNRSATPSLSKKIPSDKLFRCRSTTPFLSKEIPSDKLFNRSATPSLSKKIPSDKLFNRSATPSLSKKIPSDKLFNRSATPSLSKKIPSDNNVQIILFNRATTPCLSRKIPSDKLINRSTTPSLSKEIPSDKLINRSTTPSLSKEIPSDKLFNRSATPSLSKEIPSDKLFNRSTTPSLSMEIPSDKLFNRSATPSLSKEIPSDKLFNRSTTPSLSMEIPSDKLFNRSPTPSLSMEIPSDKLFNRSPTPSLSMEIPSDNLFNRSTTPSLSKEIPSDKLFNRSPTPSLLMEIPSELSSDEDFGPLRFSDSTDDSNSNSPTQPSTSKLFTNEDITNKPSTSKENNPGVITKAPIYYPTEEEFTDPLTFYEKIKPEASKFGVCKVVPPANFKPVCNLSGLDRVVAGSQYTARFLNRRGEGTRDLCAIRSYLSTHNVCFLRPPLVDGIELNLPKMYRTVQKYGGFSKVTQKKKWNKVAENMNLSKLKNPEKKLDQIYVKYLLPYDILTNEERNTIINKVEDRWQDAQRGLEKRARNPLHMRKVYYCESDESSDEGDFSEDERNLRKIILEEEECVKRGRLMTLATFRKVNNSAVKMYFPSGDATVDATEEVYWETVEEAVDHVCVYTASVDTSDVGYGFTTDPKDPISQHAWNLKNVRKNDGNILRSLGAVVSTTVPILHFGMFFTTNCWHRDPHGLPWIEYLHNGKAKIWYGIPDMESEVFRRAVEKLCPTAVQNKPIWLPSDICMIPPSLLLAEGVTLTRITQEPGEYIFIFPKAYSSSICTGFSISESVYFAVQPWPQTLPQVFRELRDSCEPMMFAPEQLLIAIAQDERVPLSLLRQIYSHLVRVVNEELRSRAALFEQGIPKIFIGRQGDGRPWNVNEQAECDVCRRPLFLSKVKVRLYHKALKKMCPQDAQQIREKLTTITPPRPINLTLEIFVSDAELQNVLSTGQSRLT